VKHAAGTRRNALGLLAASWLAPPLLAAPAQPGQVVPWPTVRLLDGRSWGPQQAEGKAVVAVFWLTTCPFCKRHNAHVEKLRIAAAGKPLELITVARDGDAQSVSRTLAQRGWHFPVTLDAQPMAEVLSTRRIVPLTATVDRSGRLRQVFPGEMFEEDVLELLQLAT
jgi:thiol-disulfide isomerase/thioredoxin